MPSLTIAVDCSVPPHGIRWDQVLSLCNVLIVRGEPISDDSEVDALIKQAHQITGTPVIMVDGIQLGTVVNMAIDERGQIVGYQRKPSLLQDLQGCTLLPLTRFDDLEPMP
ncbi:hypothetical protein Hgul01_05257 [Herpetosiphon gulosus]|uniref:CBS domain-containing protein n=1 Tax=Herpetosiphon gulosus TaxID=1973496 RepID=A0ABP9X7R0_9CHLR